MKSVIMVVAALMPELGIGYKGQLPWRLKNEMLNFKKITTNASAGKRNIVIMGRKTWESIPPKFKPLPNRLNIVMTRTSIGEDTNDLMYLNDFDKLLSLLKDDAFLSNIDKVFLMGGSELYNKFFHQGISKQIILTELHTSKPVDIDTHLDWDLSHWTKKSHDELEELASVKFDDKYSEKEFEYTYNLYEKD